MLGASFGENAMTSLATNYGLTLAPYQPIYEMRGADLLTDDLFKTGSRTTEVATPQLDETSMPKVGPMRDRVHFDAALARWLDDIAFDSLPDQMKQHDSFGDVIQDGTRVVPLIAASLRRSPSFLFLALEEIFGEDPVPENDYGNLQTTVSSWLQWLQR
jgi:hypothetical protein